MKFCKRLAVAGRKISYRTFMKPVSSRSIIIKAFPVVMDTITHTHDFKDSLIVTAELEVGIMCLEVAMIVISLSTKKMYENKLK